MRVRLRHRKLAQVLEESRISQNAWALRMGISRGHLSNLVKGRHRYPEGETRRKLLRATGLEFQQLFAVENVNRRGFGLAARTTRGNIMDSWMQDLRFALRSLLRSPGFSVVTLLTLALGLGANTAIFSAVEAVLLQPLPFGGAERVVTLWQDQSKQGEPKEFVSPANFVDWRRMATSFEHLVTIEPYGVDYLDGEFPQSFSAAQVSEGFFQVLSTRPLAGRLFQSDDYREGAPKVVILAEAVWRGAFAADQAIVGSALRFDGESYQVVGVLPGDFQPRVLGREWGVWMVRPEKEGDLSMRRSTYLGVLGRLREDVSLSQAQSEMDTIAARLAEQYPRANTDVGIRLEPISDHLLGPSRPLLWLLLAAVGCVLLIACSNIAGLMLVRHHSRRRTLALRGVLGAGRVRILRQLSLESLMLALGGGLLGCLLARWMLGALIALTPSDVPRLDQAAIRPPVLLFGLGLTLAAALLFGAWPALRASRVEYREALQEAGGTATESAARLRGRALLVTAQVALACVLLVGAGLLLRSFRTLMQLDPGYGVERITALQIFPTGRYDTAAKRVAYYRESIEAFRALPQVEAAGLVSTLPLSQGRLVPHFIDPGVAKAGSSPQELADAPSALMTAASPGYFETMGIRLLRGRLFSYQDSQGDIPALINESMARRLFGEGEALGQRLDVGYGRGFTMQVVGILADVRQTSLDAPARAEFYLPVHRFPSYAVTYVVRGRESEAASGEAALLPSVQRAIWAINPAQTIYASADMSELYAASTAVRRFALQLVAGFSAAALGLALLGLYAVLSFSVRCGQREIGIRRALGASSSTILSNVLRRSLFMTLAGLALGLTAAALLTRYLQTLLYQVTPTDPATFAAIALLILACSLAAAFIPALRATRTDPLRALRAD